MDARILTAIFGSESRGTTPNERARSSTKRWVRSRYQLAEWSEGATGAVLTSEEVLVQFGFEKLCEALDKGSAIIGWPHET